MAQRHIHRITVFDLEYLIFGELQLAVTFYVFFGNGQEFGPKLRTRFLAMVDNSHIAPFVRVNIVVALFLYIGIGQAREAIKYEDIPHDLCLHVSRRTLSSSRRTFAAGVGTRPRIPTMRSLPS